MPGCMLDRAGERRLEQFDAYDKPCEALVTALVVSTARARDALLELELELELMEKAT
jgi:hypothetical protein